MGNAKQTFIRFVQLFTLVGVICVPWVVTRLASAAPTYTSPNYGVDEVFMGAGGLNDMSSASYSARASLGDIAVGNASSGNFQLYGGFTTTTDPFIEFIVDAANIDLGELKEDSTKSTSATFSLRTYLASGYEVVSVSEPPTMTSGTSHVMATNASPTAPTIGTEQFGINLVANTSPTNIGADPVQIPDGTFGFGQVDDNYDNANLFKYTKNDRLAYSNSSTSFTEYTITYIYNIGGLTPAGLYVFNHILVATSTY
jgi:hypothetical protein